MPDNDPRADYAAEAERLVTAVKAAGEVALKTFRGTLRSWFKSGNSPVSEADIAVDLLLREQLAPAGYGWLSEESKDDPVRLKAERIFIVDPIDGTRAYIAGQEDWSISAALVEAGRPIVGVVHAPVTSEIFVATAGGGAFRNGERIHVSPGADLSGAQVAGPKPLLWEFQKLAPEARETRKIHSLALRLTRVAQGEIQAAFASPNGRDWDLAAADLLVHEAGGAVTTMAGESLIYNRAEPTHAALIAASGPRHARILDLFRHDKDRR